MPSVINRQANIYYEEFGNGYLVLLIAPGGHSSLISKWQNTTINPLEEFAGDC